MIVESFMADSNNENSDLRSIEEYLPYLYRRHPWHGVPIGPDAPDRLTAFIEIVPTDTVKYCLLYTSDAADE